MSQSQCSLDFSLGFSCKHAVNYLMGFTRTTDKLQVDDHKQDALIMR